MTKSGLRPNGPDFTSLSDAVTTHVQAGDTIHVMLGHSRWTAGARELARQFWGKDPGFTLVMTSIGALGAVFFRGGLLKKVITAYSGNSFPRSSTGRFSPCPSVSKLRPGDCRQR